LRPESTLSLRAIAIRLEAELGRPVRPVSLLHSTAVPPGRLDGRRAELLEPALKAALHDGMRAFGLLPLFFGPSAALTAYLPERLAQLRVEFPDMRVKLAAPLVDVGAPEDLRLASILVRNIRRAIALARLVRPVVILADHGSPQPGVTAVRDFLGRQLRGLLAGEIDRLLVASMECRPGPEYAFAVPLLADALDRLPGGDVVVALQFLSPGRHAGPGGDIGRICRAAEKKNPALRVQVTELVGADPQLAAVLADRYHAAGLFP
jgi:hypothetical protein